MRTHGFRTHVLLVFVGAVGVVASLARPWYARAPKPLPDTGDIGSVDGPLYGLFHGLQRWVSDSQGIAGRDALGTSGTALTVMAGLCALAAVATSVPAVQGIARDVLRWCAFACLALVAWRLVDPPGANAAWELRYGALVGGGAVILMFYAAMPVAAAPRRARTVTPAYVPPPPAPPVYDTSGSVGPPSP